MKRAIIIILAVASQRAVASPFCDGHYVGSYTCHNGAQSETVQVEILRAGDVKTVTYHGNPSPDGTPGTNLTLSVRTESIGNGYYNIYYSGQQVGTGFCLADACHDSVDYDGGHGESTMWMLADGRLKSISSAKARGEELICEGVYTKTP